jgi:DNA polymerase-3 subunit epsilon
MRFVSIDFETANEKRFSPCAVGIVIADAYGIADEYYSLINPLMDFSPYNIQVHGITERDVADAPTFPEIWETLKIYLDNNLVIAHNANFDMSVLRNTLDHYSLAYPEMDYLCTVNISRKIWPELYNHKLNTVAAYHDIVFDHHQALDDARAAAKIFMKAMEQQETTVLDTFLANCGMTKGRVYDRGYVAPKTKRKKQLKKITWQKG